jgi:hypothetical protein
MDTMEMLALIQYLLNLKYTLTHELIHVPLLRLVHLLAIVHDHRGPSGKAIRSQICFRDISLRVIEILIDEGVDHTIFLDFLQVSVLALILKIHLHTCIVVHLRWWLMVEEELGRILADLSSLVSLLPPCFDLRKDDATSAPTFLGYNI